MEVDNISGPEQTKEPAAHVETDAITAGMPVPKTKIHELIGRRLKINWKISLIVAGIIIVIGGLSATGYYFLRHEKQPATTAVVNKTTPTTGATIAPALVPSLLSGVMTDSTSANRHPLAVMIENHVDARPQSGLDKADVVYEALAEGGITRFMALYQTQQPDKVGPVRSIRTYYVDWAHGYNAYLAHVGGNIDALDKISAEHSFNLDEFAYSSPYWRIYAAGLATEHTMYASTLKLWAQAKTNGYSEANNFSVYKFKEETAADKATYPASQKISVNFGSSANYNVYFQYDSTTNTYKRYQAGLPHVDAVTKNQLDPKNVIVMTVTSVSGITRINEPGLTMTTVGTGKAKIFLDGKEIDGTWKKTSAAQREIFYDSTGSEVIFNRGQSWICVIPPASSVTVQ